MGTAAHRRLPFYVDEAFPAGKSLGRDPRWSAEAEVAQVVDGQAVDLPHLFSGDIQQQRAVGYHLLDALFHQVQPVDLLIDCLLNMVVLDRSSIVLACPVIGLDEQVFDLSGQLGLVRDLAGAEFQDPGGSSGLERQQAFFFASTADEGAVGHHVLFVQFHAVIELRFDLEEVPEILIVVGG